MKMTQDYDSIDNKSLIRGQSCFKTCSYFFGFLSLIYRIINQVKISVIMTIGNGLYKTVRQEMEQ